MSRDVNGAAATELSSYAETPPPASLRDGPGFPESVSRSSRRFFSSFRVGMGWMGKGWGSFDLGPARRRGYKRETAIPTYRFGPIDERSGFFFRFFRVDRRQIFFSARDKPNAVVRRTAFQTTTATIFHSVFVTSSPIQSNSTVPLVDSLKAFYYMQITSNRDRVVRPELQRCRLLLLFFFFL